MPTREEIEHAVLIKRLRIVCLSKKLAPDTYRVQPMSDGRLALVQAGRVLVIGDPVTRLCCMAQQK